MCIRDRLGTHAIDIGAMSVFLYCFREREDLLRIFEMFSGQRMMTSYFRVGGLALEPPRGWQRPVKKFLDGFPKNVEEYENLLTNNPIWLGRTKAAANCRSKILMTWGSPDPCCGRRACRGISGSRSRIPATRSSTSTSPSAQRATSTRGTRSGSRR